MGYVVLVSFSTTSELIKIDQDGEYKWNTSFDKGSDSKNLIETTDHGLLFPAECGSSIKLIKTLNDGSLYCASTVDVLSTVDGFVVREVTDGFLIGGRKYDEYTDFALIHTDANGEYSPVATTPSISTSKSQTTSSTAGLVQTSPTTSSEESANISPFPLLIAIAFLCSKKSYH